MGGHSGTVVAVCYGALISLLLLVVYVASKEKRKEKVIFWFIGQLFILLPFLLTVIGRAKLGIVQSLALRYQTLALFGLCVLFCPLMFMLMQQFAFKIGKSKRKCALFLCLVFSLHIFGQLQTVSRYKYYWRQGSLLRTFVSQVDQWNKQEVLTGSLSYEGFDTELQGLYPLRFGGGVDDPTAQLSIIHPRQYSELLDWLDHEAAN